MSEVVGKFRVRVDWMENAYGHVWANVTSLLEGLRIRYGNDVVVSEEEPFLQVGTGRMQLRADPGVFGSVVTGRQLRSVHLFEVVELRTGLLCFVGWAEFVEEWQAEFVPGDVLNFELHGLGWKRDGGTLTYPLGSEFGGSADLSQQTVAIEKPLALTEFRDVGTTTSQVNGGTTLPDGRVMWWVYTSSSGSGLVYYRTASLRTASGLSLVDGAALLRRRERFTFSITGNGQISSSFTNALAGFFVLGENLWALSYGYSLISENFQSTGSGSTSYGSRTRYDRFGWFGRVLALSNPVGLESAVTAPRFPSPWTNPGYYAFRVVRGQLFAIRAGVIYSVSGFPATAAVFTSLGTLPSGLGTPRHMVEIAGTVYVVSSNGLTLWRWTDLTDGTAFTLVGSFGTGISVTAIGFDSSNVYLYRSKVTGEDDYRVMAAVRYRYETRNVGPGNVPITLPRLVDGLALEYFDETVSGESPAELLKAFCAKLSVTANIGRSTSFPDGVSGLVRYGPQWDIALVDTAFFGWTGQLLMGLRDGRIAAVFPGDVARVGRTLSFDRLFVVAPFELRINTKLVVNSIRAEGYEIL